MARSYRDYGSGSSSSSSGTAKQPSSVSGVLNEIARTAESVGAVKKSATGGNNKVLGWVAGITGALGMLGAAAYKFIGFMPELRKDREQSSKRKLEVVRESKKPVQLSRISDKSVFKSNAELCDDSKQCFNAFVTKADEKGRFEARLKGGFILKDCSTEADGSKICIRDGKQFKVK